MDNVTLRLDDGSIHALRGTCHWARALLMPRPSYLGLHRQSRVKEWLQDAASNTAQPYTTSLILSCPAPARVLPHFPDLTRLFLETPMVSPDEMQAVGSCCPSLTTLHVHASLPWPGNVSGHEARWVRAFEALPSGLQHLALVQTRAGTNVVPVLARIAQQTPPRLRELRGLELGAHAVGVNLKDLVCIAQLARYLPRLNSLRLGGLTFGDTATIVESACKICDTLVTHVSGLQELQLPSIHPRAKGGNIDALGVVLAPRIARLAELRSLGGPKLGGLLVALWQPGACATALQHLACLRLTDMDDALTMAAARIPPPRTLGRVQVDKGSASVTRLCDLLAWAPAAKLVFRPAVTIWFEANVDSQALNQQQEDLAAAFAHHRLMLALIAPSVCGDDDHATPGLGLRDVYGLLRKGECHQLEAVLRARPQVVLLKEMWSLLENPPEELYQLPQLALSASNLNIHGLSKMLPRWTGLRTLHLQWAPEAGDDALLDMCAKLVSSRKEASMPALEIQLHAWDLSDPHVALESQAQLAGHASSHLVRLLPLGSDGLQQWSY